MPDNKTLPLDVVAPNNLPNWCDFESPMDMVKFIQQTCRVIIDGMFEGIAGNLSNTKPGSDMLDTLWIKNSSPPGIGVPYDGDFYLIYRYPPNSPFLANFTTAIPENVRMLDSSEITAFGLTDTDSSATNRMRWYIFEPIEL